MAVRFHELPVSVFPAESRFYIERLNNELRDLFALEGTLKNPISDQRSDQSIVRQAGTQVDATRVTNITTVVGGSASGASVTIGTPAFSFGTANGVGSTTTVVSINSSIALFGTALPHGVSFGPTTGTSQVAARGDHVHGFSFDTFAPTTTKGDLIVSDGATNQRVGIGPDKYVLTGNSGTTTGVTWQVSRHRLVDSYLTADTISGTGTPSSFASENKQVSAGDLAAGRVLRYVFRGVIGSTSGPATNLQIDLVAGVSPTTIVSTGSQLFTPNLTNREWEARIDVTCKSAGVGGGVEAQGWFIYATSAKTLVTWEMLNTAGVSYDTTINQTWKALVTWGTADPSNTITLRQRLIELMEAP